MKYKVGDKVRVREDLEVNKAYGEEVFVSQMTPLKGKEVTISYIDSYGYYRVKEDSVKLRWTDEMLSPITKYKIGDKVIVREDLIVGEKYGKDVFTSAMISFKGKVVTINKVIGLKYEIEEDDKTWNWTDEMFFGKVSQDFIPKESVSQNRLPEEESSPDIITVKTIKLKLYF